MLSFFWIYIIVLIVSLITSTASIYGMGKHDADKNSAEYISASVFFNAGLICMIISIILLIKDSQSYSFCSANKLFKKVEPKPSVEGIAKAVVNSPEVELSKTIVN